MYQTPAFSTSHAAPATTASLYSNGVPKVSSVLTSNKTTFLVGDCSKPFLFKGGPFDLVVAVWLLNYAPSGKELAGMFECIRMNLKEGGIFVGITQPPAEDMTRDAELLKMDPWKKYGVSMRLKEETGDGYKTRVVLGLVSSETVEFENYWLRKSVYEESARKGGVQIDWKAITLPEKHVEVLGRFDDGFWDDELSSPHMGLLVAG